jgi:hypothetical protein
MQNNMLGRRAAVSWIWPAAVCAAGATAVGLWLVGPAEGSVPGSLAAVGLAVAAVLAAVWRVRSQAWRRWRGIVDAYAAREIARARPRNVWKQTVARKRPPAAAVGG